MTGETTFPPALKQATRLAASRARQLAARIIMEKPEATEMQVRITFAEEWYELAEHVAEELLSRGLITEFREIYSRLIGITADVLGELNGASSAELADLAHRWLDDAEPEPTENGGDESR